jgi:hypothetical protein
MKTCPACSETYSERIDFCFNDGEVLVLLPSAMDAPMPRLMTAPPVRGLPREAPRRTPPPEPRQEQGAQGRAEPPRVEPPSAAEVAAVAAAAAAAGVAAVAGSTASESAPPQGERIPTESPSQGSQDKPEVSRAEGADPPAAAAEPAAVVADVPQAGTTSPAASPPMTAAPPVAPTPAPPPTAQPSPTQVAAPPASQIAPVNGPSRPPPKAEPVASPPPAKEPAAARPVPARHPKEKEQSSATMWFVGAAAALLGVAVLVWTASSGNKPAELREPAPAPRVVPAETKLTPPTPPGPIAPGPSVAPPPPTAPVVAPPLGEPPPEPELPNPAVVAATKAPSKVEPPKPTEPPPPVTPAPEPAPPPTGSPWDAPAAASIGLALISSDPTGAAVRIDGKTKGYTPLEISLPYGTYSIELDLEGFVPVRRKIDVQSPAPKFPHPMQREVRSGRVLVFFEGRDGAALEVDGEIRGTLPANITLSEGMHTFVVRGDWGELKLRREVSLADQGLTRLMLHQ